MNPSYNTSPGPFSKMLGVMALTLAIATPASVHAAEYTLGIQPIFSPTDTITSFQPLADYLSETTGHTITIKTSRSFFAYWKRSQREDFDFMLDAAHFTGYRSKYMNHFILAKVEDSISYSLVTGPDTSIFEPAELVGKAVATIGPPSLGAIHLEKMFPNPMREPLTKTVSDTKVAIEQVLNGTVVAAIIPTPLVGQYQGLNTVHITDPTPHIALSASAKVSSFVQAQIRSALLNASTSELGQQMLSNIKLSGFETPDDDAYAPFAALLEEGHSNLHSLYTPSNPSATSLTARAEAASAE